MSQPDAQSPSDFTVSLPESWRNAIAERNGPAQRIAVIEDSLRCFTYGWLSCLPVIGAGYLYPAVRRFAFVRRSEVEWNPARGYQAAGLALASVGWLITLGSWLVLLTSVMDMGDAAPFHAEASRLMLAVLIIGCPLSLAGLCLAAATAFPRIAALFDWKRFMANLWNHRGWFAGLACVWVTLPFWHRLILLAKTYWFLGPIISWSCWMLGGLGCLLLQRLSAIGKPLICLAWAIWLTGAWLLAQMLVAD